MATARGRRNENSEAAIFARLWDAGTRRLSPGLARHVLKLRFSDQDKTRMHELAEKNQAALVPFLLEGVGGKPELNQPDHIHPTAEGHKIVADNVWKVLKPVLTQ